LRRPASGTAYGCWPIPAATWTCPRPKVPTTAAWRRSAPAGKARSRASGYGKPRTARRARVGGGQRWFGYTRIYANPDEPNHKKRHILREEINPVEADAIRDAVIRVLDHGESIASIAREWTARGIKPVAAKQWWPTSIVGTLISARLAGLREWQARSTAPRSGPRLSMPTLMSVWSSCSAIRRGVSTWSAPRRICCRASRPAPSAARACTTGGTRATARIPTGRVKGPAGCGRTAIKAELLEEYVTGAVLDALESPRVQEALREGEDQHAPRRAELLEQIRNAQERRDEACRDYSDRVIDRADWLDIRQRTEDDISARRREYDRLTESATVMSDIPPSERVRDAWESWSTDRRRAVIRAVLHRVIIKPLPSGANANVAGNSKNKALRLEREMAILRQRVEFDWRI